jgi:hypothetical protein
MREAGASKAVGWCIIDNDLLEDKFLVGGDSNQGSGKTRDVEFQGSGK